MIRRLLSCGWWRALGLCVLALPAPAQLLPQAPARSESSGKVVAVRVVGNQRYTAEQLAKTLGQELGKAYDPRRAEEGMSTLWKAYKVRPELVAREVEGGIELVLSVVEMPSDLEPRFIGNAEVDRETLLRWAQLDERGELYLYQAERVRQRLLEGYRQEGYHHVEIEIRRRGDLEQPSSAAALPDVIFEIREGPKVRVRDLVLHGNSSLPDTGAWWWKNGLKQLSKPELSGPSLFNWLGTPFVRQELDADLLAMREVYRDLGWLDAVVELQRLEWNKDRSRVTVHIAVDEGPRYRVAKLSLIAVERTQDPNAGPNGVRENEVPLLFPEAELRALCKLKPGDLYQRARQREDGAALRSYYGERGYASHASLPPLDSFQFLEPELVVDTEQHTVELIYKLQQGRKRYIREVLFAGGEHTRDRVLRREIDVLPGELVDMREVNRSLSRLYSTNYFSDEFQSLDHRDPTYRFLSTPDPDWVDLEYEVTEGRVVDFTVNAGVDSNNGLFGRVLLQMRNFDISNTPSSLWSFPEELYEKEAFHGAGQTLLVELSPGTVQRQARLRFFEPDIFTSHFDPYSLDLDFTTRLRFWRFYDEDRSIAQVLLGRQFGRNLSLAVGPTIQAIDISDIEGDFPPGFAEPDELPLPEGIYEMEGFSRLQGLLFNATYSDLDNRINPMRGSRATWRNGIYGGVMGGDWQFARTQADYDYFWQPGDPEDLRVRSSFHLSVGAGLSEAYGETEDVPYTERFFLGGLGTVRGFALRGIGPNVGGEPIGGQTMLTGSLEWRIPLHTQVQPGTYIERETFRFTVFADAGVLDPNFAELDFGELRSSVGFGLGMSAPLPLGFYFGFPLQKGEGDRTEVLSFSLSTVN